MCLSPTLWLGFGVLLEVHPPHVHVHISSPHEDVNQQWTGYRMMDNNVNMRAKRILPGYASGCNLRQADTCLWMYLGIFKIFGWLCSTQKKIGQQSEKRCDSSNIVPSMSKWLSKWLPNSTEPLDTYSTIKPSKTLKPSASKSPCGMAGATQQDTRLSLCPGH